MRLSKISTSILEALGVTASSTPSVTLGAGTLTGGHCPQAPDAAFFKAIPYAQPPVGDLRLAAPKPYTGKYEGGRRNATVPAPSCVQFSPLFAEHGKQSEDCLYVDVWKPANATGDSKLPVRVWIYGGGNLAGGISDPAYDGCHVPSSGAIMVAVNYRVGPIGYLSLETAGLEGNYGISDILLGLQWVQDNIAAFGGDPNKVMLHGQSAGATDTFVVATLPGAPKLISAGIFESGGGRDIPRKDTIEAVGKDFVEALNCSISDAACIRGKSAAEMGTTLASLPVLQSKYAAMSVTNIFSPSFQPYVDGKVIPEQPSTQGVRVPSVFGSTSQEGTIFGLAQFATLENPPAAYNASVYRDFLSTTFGAANAKVIEQYRPVSAFNSTPFPAFYAAAQVITDWMYKCTAYRGLNAAAAKGVPVWTYEFSHTPSCHWISYVPEALPLELIGATHTAEIPFMLGITEHMPPPNGTCEMTSNEKVISKFLEDAWTMMAAEQRPVADASAWPAYTGPTSSMGINIVNASVPGRVDYSACAAVWDKIEDQLLSKAYNGTGAGSSTTGPASPTSSC